MGNIFNKNENRANENISRIHDKLKRSLDMYRKEETLSITKLHLSLETHLEKSKISMKKLEIQIDNLTDGRDLIILKGSFADYLHKFDKLILSTHDLHETLTNDHKKIQNELNEEILFLEERIQKFEAHFTKLFL